jgi:hypothetical protein
MSVEFRVAVEWISIVDGPAADSLIPPAASKPACFGKTINTVNFAVFQPSVTHNRLCYKIGCAQYIVFSALHPSQALVF